MESIPSDGQETGKTARVVMTSRPEPRIMVNGYELTGTALAFHCKVDTDEALATFTVAADLELDMDMDGVTIVTAGPAMEPVTADELDQVLIGKGFSETPGEALLQYLKSVGVPVAE